MKLILPATRAGDLQSPSEPHAGKGRRLQVAGTVRAMVALVLAATLVACKRHDTPASPSLPPLPTAIVRVLKVESQRRMAVEEIVGTVRPKLSAAVSAKVSGSIVRMLVAPGQAVKAGALLVQLDAREIQARLDQATALREQTSKDLQRFQKLIVDKAVTQQEFDAVQARQRVAAAAVTEAETQLGYTKILAPFDGVITHKRADVGDLATPGRALLELENPAALRLEADVPEALVGNLKLGDNLPVHIAALKAELSGRISEIAPAADAGSRTFLVKLDLPATSGLRSGQFGRVAIPVAEVNALRVPASAVVVRGQMEMVFVVTGQQAQMRLVKTGKRLGPEIEIVSGINSDESLVVEGASALTDGQPVQVKP
ncbi:MAG: RND family efflux transporter MFP subunit [Limisphaerales bacterium]|nr:MAG: RND family efflux transporter MFP subunit [Limisphaerales bacterium]KAG0506726.1 MAG: RND family efflux transporter MFP subunit [Limisphaerales bacterium]TXT51710.1 MAG: RND family efflux transporter MFP subunit [Limisphaerales bacterium]